MRYWFPFPLLTLGLLAMWLVMTRSATTANLLLGIFLSVPAAWAMVNLQPLKSRLNAPGAMLRLAGHVVVDIALSNIKVAGSILKGLRRKPRSGFATVRLTLTDENGLAILACILTATPGTAWLSFDRRSGVLLLHILDLDDAEDWPTIIRDRYEKPLLEIFR
ncbi:Na+/H+ antiporter subunit E [Rhizobium sp. SG2393]|uniref:Na+/H+ antiporter subunit E n=1 Tax=Rhizobium sp. SG2393 TaxID=3276279 RepID=UPI00366AD94C